MTNSKSIAGLVGPACIAIATSEWINFRTLATSTSPLIIYLNGSLLFVAGLAIVRAHKHWTLGWAVVVTSYRLGAYVRRLDPDVRSCDGRE